MSTQNSFVIAKKKFMDIMLDDKHRSADDIAKHIMKGRKKHRFTPPEHLRDEFDMEGIGVVSRMYYRIRPKGVVPTKKFFYFHGGGHCFEITKGQWEFVATLVKESGYEAIVPIYPLAPENSCQQTFDMITNVYKTVMADGDCERVLFVGDNTGGGLALSMAILAWENGLRRPDKLILLSPVLDTEFMDRNMENAISDKKKETYKYYYRPAIKDFLKQYWIRDLYHQNAYTSPLYGDLTDICDEITIYTVENDLLNCYARELYDKVKQQQIRIHFYEYFGIVHDYIEHPYVPECKAIIRKIAGSIKDEAKTVSGGVKKAVWARSMVAQRYPHLFEDDESIKLSNFLKVEHKEINKNYSEYDRLITMSRILEVDKRVKQFIKRYADGVVVHVGPELDPMFARMDNGRLRWYNVDMPEMIELRKKFVDSRDRETNISKSIMDFSWMDSVKKDPGQAILFVCSDVTKYFTTKRLQSFLNALWEKFPGAEVVFDIKNSRGKKRYNRKNIMEGHKAPFLKVSIDNCIALMYGWNVKYRVLYDAAILNKDDVTTMFSEDMAKKYKKAIKRKYDKIIQLRLGTEHVIADI